MIVSVMVVCAVLASMAFGVLVAYGFCLGFFRLIGAHTVAIPAPQSNPVEAASKV